MHMASIRESRDSDGFLVNTQVQSHALLRRGFGTSVPFILHSVLSQPPNLKTVNIPGIIIIIRCSFLLQSYINLYLKVSDVPS